LHQNCVRADWTRKGVALGCDLTACGPTYPPASWCLAKSQAGRSARGLSRPHACAGAAISLPLFISPPRYHVLPAQPPGGTRSALPVPQEPDGHSDHTDRWRVRCKGPPFRYPRGLSSNAGRVGAGRFEISASSWSETGSFTDVAVSPTHLLARQASLIKCLMSEASWHLPPHRINIDSREDGGVRWS
jgi:hypothetical protein